MQGLHPGHALGLVLSSHVLNVLIHFWMRDYELAFFTGTFEFRRHFSDDCRNHSRTESLIGSYHTDSYRKCVSIVGHSSSLRFCHSSSKCISILALLPYCQSKEFRVKLCSGLAWPPQTHGWSMVHQSGCISQRPRSVTQTLRDTVRKQSLIRGDELIGVAVMARSNYYRSGLLMKANGASLILSPLLSFCVGGIAQRPLLDAGALLLSILPSRPVWDMHSFSL